MGKVYDALTEKHCKFIGEQHMFFVATAPLQEDGHINCSPKGLDDTFQIIDETHVAYLDLTGSGIETIAHVRENGRMTLMFCGFQGPPNILRLYGKGHIHLPHDARFEHLQERFPQLPGVRAIIEMAITRVQDSCGFSVPFYQYEGQRKTLIKYAEKKGPINMAHYRTLKNRFSIDGLPGLDA